MKSPSSWTRCSAGAGFSTIELLVSMSVLLAVLAVSFQAVTPAQTAMLAEPERSDMQQRARVAVTVLSSEIQRAGGGSPFSSAGGTLARTLPPIVPFRRGRRLPDPPGAFRRDTVSLLYRADAGPDTTLAVPLPDRAGDAVVSVDPGCRVAEPACGFEAGMNVFVADRTRSSLFSIVSVSGGVLTLLHDSSDSLYVFPAGETHIVQVLSRTYYLKADPVASEFQLMRYAGDGGNDVPVIDHVVDLDFAYLVEAAPPQLTQPRGAPTGPWTTYGPPPPLPGVQNTLYPPGESCLFEVVGGVQVPRLPTLAGGGVVPIAQSELVDGPWCPDASDPNRFDADLLRVRAVRTRFRVEAAADAFRGPAGVLFTRAGTAPPNRWLPDLQLDMTVAARSVSGAP